MSVWDSLRAIFTGGRFTTQIVYVGDALAEIAGQTPDQLYRSQPHLRTVVSFRARNIAQLPLHVYRRVDDADRERVHDDPVARLLSRPNPVQTAYDLIFQTVVDYDLHDVAYWMICPDKNAPSLWSIWGIPPAWIAERKGSFGWGYDGITVQHPNGTRFELGREPTRDAAWFVEFRGYTPGSPARPASPVEALKEILAEQIQAWSYRQQVWQRGGRVGAYLTRPAGAPEWSAEGRDRFMKEWREDWTSRRGAKAGGTPILEDGMQLQRIGFSAREDEWAEVAKLSLATVASVYHTNPTMVGVLDNANYSNVREFSRMLYTDTLGPTLAMIEQRLNTFIVPNLAEEPGLYCEFNLQAKLAGSFEEQAKILSTSVGAPWMTVNEARARMNLPAVEGGDERIIPLNVMIGGQPSPQTPIPEDAYQAPAITTREAEPVRIKSTPPEELNADAAAMFRRFFEEQAEPVLQAIAESKPWWDGEKWDAILAARMFQTMSEWSQILGEKTLASLGTEADWDAERTRAFIQAVADDRASKVNETTRRQLEAALEQMLDEDSAKSTPEGVFDEAKETRAEEAGGTFATTIAGFALVEAGKQSGKARVTKTWITGKNPRPSHAAMNGETVGVRDRFSNGMEWPGSKGAAPDEIANCNCEVEITVP